MNDVIKRHLLEELQVWPWVSELEVMPIRFLREAYGIDKKKKKWMHEKPDVRMCSSTVPKDGAWS